MGYGIDALWDLCNRSIIWPLEKLQVIELETELCLPVSLEKIQMAFVPFHDLNIL